MNDIIRESGFVKAEKVIEKVLIENDRVAILHFGKIRKYWEVIVGKPLTEKTMPAKLINQTLHVMVVDSAYSHQLRFFEKRILELIESPEICGEGIVKKIVFQVNPEYLIVNKHIRKVLPPVAETQIKPEVLKQIETVQQQIKDKKLQRVFGRFMTKTLSAEKNQVQRQE